MRNLRRRIEALERSNSANLGRYQAIAERAMGCLQPDDVVSLLAAYGALLADTLLAVHGREGLATPPLAAMIAFPLTSAFRIATDSSMKVVGSNTDGRDSGR